ncbi:MAG: hypothetical protein ABIT71_26490 [Vicinamibacteraceae bacterium]
MARRVGRHAAIFVGFLLVAIVATWPLVRHLDDAFTGPPGGDTGVYVWNAWVFTHELQQGRLPFYTTSILGGTPDAPPANLSLHNYTTAANVLAWPLIPLVGLVAAFNLVFLFNIALSGYAAWLLTREMTGRDAESLLAGLVFALSPVLIARGVGHYSLVAAAPLPIFALLLRRLGATGQVRYAFALGAVVAWATCSDAYYGIFCLLMAGVNLLIQFVSIERAVDMPVIRIVGLRRTLDVLLVALGSFVLAIALRGGGTVSVLGISIRANTLYTPMLILTVLVLARLVLTRRPRLSLRPDSRPFATARAIAAAGVVMALLLAPVLYAFGDQVFSGNADLSAPLWRSSPRGVDLLALILPNPNHALWGATMQDWLTGWAQRGDAFPEAVGSVSLVAIALLIAAWARFGWRPSRIRIGATVFYALLALGPFVYVAGINTQIPMPWSVLRYVPILGMVRSPGRFSVLVAMCVAILLAQALAHLGRRYPERRRQILATVGVLLAIELIPGPRTLYSASIPALYQAIASDPRPDIRVLELPVGLRDGTSSMGNFSARTQYFQTAHGKAIIGGYLSRVSPRRRRDASRAPVLSALFTLSEGRELTAEQEVAARGRADEFLRRSRLGYVVIDETLASPGLVDFSIDLLGLTLVAREGPLALYVPRAEPPPGR